jgi:two-component system, LuxR family, sensor kinase FixL
LRYNLPLQDKHRMTAPLVLNAGRRLVLSRAFGILILLAQALWAMTVSVALAQDKPSAVSNLVNREVIAVVPRSWPPQYDVDESGNPVGFAIDVMNEIARRTGLSVSYRVLENFAEVDKALEAGQADIVPNAGFTPERAARSSFTAPVQVSLISIIVRAGTTGINGLGDLAGRHVGIVESSVGEKIIEPYENIQPVIFKDTVSAFFGLLSGQVDALIYAQSVIAALARKAGVEDRVATVGEPLAEIKRAIRVQKNKPELLAVLDRAVQDFVGSPDYQQLYVKWYGGPSPYWTGHRIAWAAGGVIAALLLFFALWRYRMVVHMNRRIAASEEKFRDLIEGSVPGVLIHRDHRPLFVNQSYARIFGYDGPEELLRQESALDHVAPRDRERLKGYAEARLHDKGVPTVYEFRGVRKDGSLIWLENRGRVVYWEGAPAIQRTVVDVTDKWKAEAALMRRSSQQAVIAELGQQVLMEKDMSVFYNTAVTLVTKVLGADFGKFLELLPGGNELLLRTGVGWKPGLIGRVTVGAGQNSQAGFTLLRREPVIVNDLRQETRFKGPRLLTDHGVVSGVSVVVGDPERPFGVLAVHTKTQRAFSEDDGLFLKTIAVLLASAISRKRAEDARRAGEERLRGAIDSLQEGFILFDAEDRLVMVNDVYRRTNPDAQKLLDKRANFEELIRANVKRGIIADATGREDEFIRERLAQHRNPKGSIVRHHIDGRWLIVRETRTPEGGVAITFTDITELRRADQARHEAERHFQIVVDNLPMRINVKDRNGRYVSINNRFKEWYGLSASDVIGKFPEEVSDMLKPSAPRREAHQQAVIETKTVISRNEKMMRLDGKLHDIEVTKFPVLDANGEVRLVGTISTDVTERRQADLELRQSEARFRAVIDHSPGVIIFKDLEGRYLIASETLCRWYRTENKHMLGKAAGDFLSKESTALIAAHERKVLDTRAVVEQEHRITFPDGVTRDVWSQKFPIFGAAGECVAVGTVISDITGRKAEEKKMAELQTELAHVSRVSTMGEMAAGLAHELNQPLAAITNYAKGTLRRLHAGGGDPVDLLPIMELVAEQALRAGDIVRKVRGFMNRSEPHKSRIELHDTVDEVMSLVAGEINIGGIEVAVDVPKSLPPVMADSIQVQQVLLNLIRNAVSAMNGDGANHHRLEVKAQTEGLGDVEIYVRDNGPGVPSDLIDRLFEPFFTTKTDGLGMGLSISRSIVTSHNGRIWFSSEAEKGATFHFTLPIVTGGKRDAA